MQNGVSNLPPMPTLQRDPPKPNSYQPIYNQLSFTKAVDFKNEIMAKNMNKWRKIVLIISFISLVFF